MKEPPKIVVLTEKRVEQTISQCFQNGVDDYVTKPFSPVELDARIRRAFIKHIVTNASSLMRINE